MERVPPKTLTFWQLYQYQRFFIIKFYSKHALRGDLADVKINKGKPQESWFIINKKGVRLHVGSHKTVKSRGAIDLNLDADVAKYLKIFLKMVKAKTKHGFLLSTRRGAKLKRADMLKLVSSTTENRIGKKIGIQILRVLKTTQELKSLDKAHELQKELAHSAFMQRQYISRPST